MDVTDRAGLLSSAAAACELGRIDVVLRMPGVIHTGTVLTSDPADLEHVVRVNDDSTHSSRASLAAFVNGPTDSQASRQGLNSALLGQGDPLKVLAWRPGQGRYSSLWHVHLSECAPGRTPRRITQFADVEDRAHDAAVTGPTTAVTGPTTRL